MAKILFEELTKAAAEAALNSEYEGLSVREWARKITEGQKQLAKRGHWAYDCNERNAHCYFCSECQKEAYWDSENGQQLFGFCPYCGAEMKGVKDQ